MLRLNFKNPDMFEYRFKRKPKMWTLEQLYDLWERTIERAALRAIERNKIVNDIVANIPTTKRYQEDTHIVFFTPHHGGHDGDSLYYYSFSYNKEFECYAHSSEQYIPNKNELELRDEKLYQMLNPLAFELGQKYYEAKRLDTNLQYRIRHILWDEVEEILREKYKGKRPPEIFTIDLCGHKYFVHTDPQSRGYWNKFELKGVCNFNETIYINELSESQKSIKKPVKSKKTKGDRTEIMTS
jgi:hypothetical protein